jgi:hypothetical protein
MVSTINGYLCFSSCDEAKAKHGKDPRELADTQPHQRDRKTLKASTTAGYLRWRFEGPS